MLHVLILLKCIQIPSKKIAAFPFLDKSLYFPYYFHVKDITAYYRSCKLCPRKCGIDRTAGKTGYCGQSSEINIAAALLHGGEEPPVSGKNGSGTVFFTGCTLKCSFCQNSQISRESMGRTVSTDEFAEICLNLQERGAENINLVTGTHFIPSVVDALSAAKKNGLVIPVLWNSSGYETEEAVERLSSQVDLFLPDYKTADASFSSRFFNAPDYPEAVFKAVSLMCSLKKTDFSIFETGEMIRGGVIIRHLVMPGYIESTEKFIKIYAEKFMDRAILSLMFQYSPSAAGKNGENPERSVSSEESDRVYDLLDFHGIENGFIQELEDSSDWIPDFNNAMPFPGGSDKNTVWHWREGFIR